MYPWALGTIESTLASYTADVSDPRITVESYCGKENVAEGTPYRSFHVPHSVGAALLLEKTPPFHNGLQLPGLSIMSGYFWILAL